MGHPQGQCSIRPLPIPQSNYIDIYIYISFDSTYTFFFYIPLYFLICRYSITMAPMEKGFSWSNIAVGELTYFIRAPQHPLDLQRCCSLRSAGTCRGDGSVGCMSMPNSHVVIGEPPPGFPSFLIISRSTNSHFKFSLSLTRRRTTS